MLALLLAAGCSGPSPAGPAPGAARTLQFTAKDQAALQGDVVDLLVAGILVAAGLASLGLWRIRPGGTARPLIYLGFFCLLYSLRLLADTDVVAPLAGLPGKIADFAITTITYVIPLFGLLFVEDWLGPGWRSSLRRMRQLQVVYAWGAILTDAFAGTGTAMPLNTPLVLLGLVVMVMNIALSLRMSLRKAPAGRQTFARRDLRVVLAGVAVAVLLTVNQNLINAGVVPWRVGYEPLGLLALIASLAYVVGDRFVAGERQMVAVAQELDTARRIQASILPHQAPVAGRLGIAARYLPMASVGGDFYDYVAVAGDTGRLGLLVADVSGHGVPAALIASMVKIALASQSTHAVAPAELLAGMNRILCGNLERAFVTAAYLFLDPAAGRLVYASAGHPPLLLWRREDRAVREVRLEALPLGRFRQAVYAATELRIAAGDRLLLYTDGVTEARSPAGELFGDERLRDLLASAAGESAEKLADTLLERLAAWCGRAPGEALDDDVTLLVVDVGR